jgi:hypothetical protein
MSEEFINVLVFVLVFIVVPWGFIFGLRLLGSRRGYESQFAPQEEPPADRPLRCRLNLFHRWRTMRTPTGDRYQRCLDCGRTRDIPMVGRRPRFRRRGLRSPAGCVRGVILP